MHCFPDANQQSLLYAVLATDLKAGYSDFLRWQQATDFMGDLHPSEVRCLPLIWQRYKQFMANNPLKDRFSGIYKKSFYNNSRFFHQLASLVEVLDAAGITYALTNGMALYAYVYEDLGIRPCNEIDVLVLPEEFRQAIATLQQLGFSLRHPARSPDNYIQGHRHVCVVQNSELISIYVYTYPAPYVGQRLSNQFFLHNRQRMAIRGVSAPVLSPANLGLFLLITNQLTNNWFWLADFVRLQQQQSIPLSSLRTLSQQTGLFQVTWQQIDYLINQYGVDAAAELAFYQAQPMSFANRCLTRSTSFRDLRWRIGTLASSHGLTHEIQLTPRLLTAIVWWAFQALRNTRSAQYAGKLRQFVRDVWPRPKQESISR